MNTRRDYAEIAADVVKAKNGDGAAMNRIIADVQDSVYYTCLRVLRSESAAQDAAQDVLVSVFTKLRTLRDAGAYIGWVNRITANVCKERLSAPCREVFPEPDEDGHDPFAAFEDIDEQNIPDKAMDNSETRRMIVEIVNTLPDEQRMCVMLYYYDEMKTREIADALDVSEGTIKSRLNYARKAIREGVERLEKQGDFRLHGLSPIPFLGYWLRSAAEESVSPVTLQIVRAAAGGAASGTAVSAAAASGGAASAAAASAAELGAAVGTGAVSIVGRIAAGVLSVGLLLGVGYGVWHSFDRERPIIPDSKLTASLTEDASAAPEETPRYMGESKLSPEPAAETHLFGVTYYRGAKFTVDQDYRANDAIRLTYENDETVFTLDVAEFELETETGTFIARETRGGEQIKAGESGMFEPVWTDASGIPTALSVRGIVPQSEDSGDASFRIVFTDSIVDETVQNEQIRGQAAISDMRLSVDHTYTDNGMGKIVLRVQNGGNSIRFGGTERLRTSRGDFDASAAKTFGPNADETVTLYFDNARGIPSELTINEIVVLGDDGQPIGESESVTIRFNIMGQTSARPASPAPTATPAPTDTPAPTATPAPTDTPAPTPREQKGYRYWMEWVSTPVDTYMYTAEYEPGPYVSCEEIKSKYGFDWYTVEESEPWWGDWIIWTAGNDMTVEKAEDWVERAEQEDLGCRRRSYQVNEDGTIDLYIQIKYITQHAYFYTNWVWTDIEDFQEPPAREFLAIEYDTRTV